MNLSKISLLYAESDNDFARLLRDYLDVRFEAQLKWTFTTQGSEVFRLFKTQCPDMVLISTRMASCDTFAITQDIRCSDTQTPIILLAHQASTQEMSRGFESGADEFILKQEVLKEGWIRLHHWIHKTLQNKQGSVIWRIGKESTFNVPLQKLTVCHQEFHLPRMEANILALLCEHKNQLVLHDDILKCGTSGWMMNQNNKEKSISHIRKYLAADDSVLLESVKTKGYVLKVIPILK